MVNFMLKVLAFVLLVLCSSILVTQDRSLDNCLTKGFTINQCILTTK